MPFPVLRTEGELKPESTISEVADAIKASWATMASSLVAQEFMTKPEADEIAAALVYYAGPYVIESTGRVYGDTVGTDEEAEPWMHSSRISDDCNKRTIEFSVEKRSKAEYTRLSFGPTEGPDSVTHPVTLSVYVKGTKYVKKTEDKEEDWHDTEIVPEQRIPLAEADIYVPGV